MIAIVDYGAGNAVNVRNALEKMGVQSQISSDLAEWKRSDAIVFPGVGAFGSCISGLGPRLDVLEQLIGEKPFLGICIGMQLLMEGSDESPAVPGMGIVKGRVKRFYSALPVPQIGWNKVEEMDSPLFDGMKGMYAYYVNSFYCDPEDKSWVAATTEYGVRFASAFWKKNVFATQFHPEKSGDDGLKTLKNFIAEVKR